MRQTFPAARRIDLLDEALYQSYLANVGLFAEELRSVPAGSTVCVDEMQRLPHLLNEVHRFIEDRRLRFILCGSSARKLKRKAPTCSPVGRCGASSIRFCPPSWAPISIWRRPSATEVCR